MAEYFGSHFGTYEIERRDDGVRLLPFHLDPDPSPLGASFLDLANHPERTLAPMVRKGWLATRESGDRAANRHRRGLDEFVRVSWDEAASLVAEDIDRVRTTFGNSSIFGGSYGWASAGRFHHAQSQIKRLLNMAGGFTSSVNTYSYGTAAVILPHVIGREYKDAGIVAPSWDQIAAHTDHLIAFGGLRLSNAQVEAGGTGSHRATSWLARALERGLKVTVVSPTKSDAPDHPNVIHVPLRPNSDTAVLLSMCHVLISRELCDRDFLDRYTVGYSDFARYLTGEADGIAKNEQWASALSGVPEETIIRLALSVAADKTVVNLAWALQRARFGEQLFWATIALISIAGKVGQPGCGFSFGLTAVNSVGQPIRRLKGPAVSQGINRVPDFIPVAAISDLLLRPGETLDYDGRTLTLPDIRMVYWAGGNPFHHHQDLNRLAAAFRTPETVIVHENMWTATAKFADIVLPSAMPFERNDIAASSRDNWIIASTKVSEPPEGVYSDHTICAMIADKLGFADAFTEKRSEQEWIRSLYDGYRDNHPELPDFDGFWQQGYAELDRGNDCPRPVNPLSEFVADPAIHPLSTPSGKIELCSETIRSFGYDDCPSHASWLGPEEWPGAARASKFPFHLMSPQPTFRLHSQLEKATPSQESKVGGYETVEMNDSDAAARGISKGSVVEIFNDRGICLASAIPSGDVMSGVLVLQTGAWYRPVMIGGEIVDAGGNPNTLTADIRSSRLSQGPAPNSTLVDIRLART